MTPMPGCLVTAIGSMSCDAVATALRGLGWRCVGSSMHPADWSASARLFESVHTVPPGTHPRAFVESVLAIAAAHDLVAILPLTDPEVDAIVAHADLFSGTGVTPMLPPSEVARLCRDKLGWSEVLSAAGIGTIPTRRLEDPLPGQWRFPLLVKPRSGRSSEGLLGVEDPALLAVLRETHQGQDLIVQPRLDGDVLTVDVVRQARGGRCVAVARRELLRTANGAGLAVRVEPDSPAVALAVRIAEQLGINGCINMEFIDSAGGPVLMDINPRFSAGVAFSRLAGYDMVGNHLRCHFGSEAIDDAPRIRAATFTRQWLELEATAPANRDGEVRP